jgi:hypothetical protein
MDPSAKKIVVRRLWNRAPRARSAGVCRTGAERLRASTGPRFRRGFVARRESDEAIDQLGG